MIADLYLRVSTKDQADNGTSLDSQEKECRKKAVGFEIGKVFREDFPGDTLDRPLLWELRQRVRNHISDAVIFYDPDRLARDPILQAIMELEFEKHHATYIYVTESSDTSPEGRLVRYIKGYAAQMERLQIRERTMRGKKERALRGKLPTGGGGLYGYTYRKDWGIREVNEDEARIVRIIFEWLVKDDCSIWQIAKRLTEMEIPTPKGNTNWGTSTILRISRCLDYTGKTYCQKIQSVPPKTRKSDTPRYKNASNQLRPKEDWIELPDITPPIIDEKTFYEAQDALKRHSKHAVRNCRYPYLLRGHLECGVCHRPLYGQISGKYHNYVCASRYDPHAPKCANPPTRAEELDVQIWETVKQALLDPKTIIAGIAERLSSLPDENQSLQIIEDRIKKIRKQEERLVRLYSFGEIDDELIGKQSALLKQERLRLEEESENIRQRSSKFQTLSSFQQTVTHYCERAARNIEQFTFEEKRDALEGLQIIVTMTEKKAVVNGLMPQNAITESRSCDRIPFSIAV